MYGPPVKILVTDENRNNLMPRFVLKKTSVLPNVPYKGKYIYGNSGSGNLTICYFGTLSRKRGSEFLNDIIKINPEIRIIAAGWVVDTYTKNLISQDNVKFLGVKSQEEVNLILAQYGDYLLGVYPLNNLNNINASPNKIYDSIHTKTPIIINKGVKVSSFVRSNNIGYIVDDTNKDMRKIVKDLILKKNGFTFSNKLIDKYCWENFEKVLIDCHQNLK